MKPKKEPRSRYKHFAPKAIAAHYRKVAAEVRLAGEQDLNFLWRSQTLATALDAVAAAIEDKTLASYPLRCARYKGRPL